MLVFPFGTVSVVARTSLVRVKEGGITVCVYARACVRVRARVYVCRGRELRQAGKQACRAKAFCKARNSRGNANTHNVPVYLPACLQAGRQQAGSRQARQGKARQGNARQGKAGLSRVFVVFVVCARMCCVV